MSDILDQSFADHLNDAEIVGAPTVAEPAPMIGTSLRIPLALLEWAKVEAENRGYDSWSQLVRELLEAERTAVADDTPVTVTMGDLRRAISAAVHRSVAA